ncbi:MAG: hypothetical protein P4L43_18495 [Syntrophobacteraceae bacterium]|nr:hypothetical protein [Syntrophobacteraceae bacterium]
MFCNLRRLAILCLVTGAAFAAAVPARAQKYGASVNLSNNSAYNYYIQINDQGRVVWVNSNSPSGGSGTYQLYLYDGNTTKVIRSTTNPIQPPKINASGVVVWTENGALWLYKNGVATSITPTSELAYTNPSLNDSAQIAYAGEDLAQYENGIFLYSGGGVTEIATGNGGNPALNDKDQIIYADSNSAIHLGVGVISPGSSCNDLPEINGAGQAIWQGSPGCTGAYGIYFFDGAAIEIISPSGGNDSLSHWQRGQINDGGQAVWQDYNGNNGPDIYLYSGGAALNLTNSPTVSMWNGEPQINDNGQVAWYGADPVKFGSQLYLYSDGAVQQLVDNAGSSNFLDDFTGSPAINNQGQIAYIGNDQQVYLISPVGLWQNATPKGNGWYHLSWFGDFNTNNSPWIYHNTLGWLYPFGTSTDNLWFYDNTMKTFWWTSATVYPYVYRARDGHWLYYVIPAQGQAATPRWFCDLTTGLWESD